MSADPIDFAPRLTILPPRAHGTHCEFLVFGMMSDIETTIRRELRSVAGHEAWPILQRLFDAHLRQLRLQFSDLWLDIDQPREKTLADLERLIDAAAHATGLDRADLRRRNMVPAAEMPMSGT